MSAKVVSFEALHRFTRDAFLRVGLSQTDAATGADVLVTTDAWGVFTHGTKCLAGYVRRLQAGGQRGGGGARGVGGGGGWGAGGGGLGPRGGGLGGVGGGGGRQGGAGGLPRL